MGLDDSNHWLYWEYGAATPVTPKSIPSLVFSNPETVQESSNSLNQASNRIPATIPLLFPFP
uniref:Uncharacterized protein n=1 Tax=uncultured planctomycete 8FN TaxID=455070 RepID=A9LH13_9BACT|nr:hypothetical protein 8FN_12 [uncultured planctomycete 8FN]